MTAAAGPDDLDALLAEREWVARVARALAGDSASAADLEQDAWLAAVRARPAALASVRAWFRTVMRRRAAEEARTGSRRERRECAAARPEAVPSTEAIVARAEAHRRVVEAVLALDEPLRTTVVLRYFEGLEPAEIGARVGAPADTVRARLRRAHELLRARLAPRRGEDAPAWALLLALPRAESVPRATPLAPSPLTGGLAVAQTMWKGAAAAACLAVAAAGAALWLWNGDAADDAVRETSGAGDGANLAVTTDADAAKPAARPSRGPRPGDVVADAGAARAALVGDVRLVAGDRAAEGVAVQLRGAAGAAETVTDASGAFRFERVAPGGPYHVTASRQGLATARAAGVRVEAGETRRLDTLWLDEPIRARVRVVAPDGAAIEGAEVQAYRARGRIERQDWTASLPEPEASVATDAAGEALFADLSVGAWTFRATHADFAPGGASARPVLLGGVALEVLVRLDPGHELTGRVSGLDGAPLADTIVLVLPPIEAETLMTPRPIDPLRVETRTGADGVYRFRALPAGEHALAVLLPGALPARVGIVTIPSVTRFDVKLDGAALTGRVTEEGTGKPIEGARVRAAVWRRHSPTFLSGLTDAEGRYRLLAPLGGILQGPARGEGQAAALPVHFDVEKEGFVYAPEAGATPWRNVWVFGGKDAEMDAVMRPAASLAGRVTGGGAPIAGAEVVADVWHLLRGSLPSRTTTDSDGRYRFPGLPEGRARLVVTHPGWFQTASPGGPWRDGRAPDPRAVAEIPGKGAATLDVELSRGGALRGAVTGEDGAPVPAATVTCAAEGDPPRVATTDAAGRFEIAGVRPGVETTLTASCDGWADTEASAVAQADASSSAAEVRLVLARAGVVRGRVSGPGGGAAPGAWVQVAPAKLALDGAYEAVGVWQGAPRHAVAPDGAFEAPIPWAQGASREGVVVRAGAPGLAPAISERLSPSDGVADAGTLRLEQGLTLAGRVVAADGSGPVAGAEIEFQNERLPPALAQRRDWSTVGRDQTPFEIVARTGADGRFAIEGLPPWRYELRVNAEGFGGAAPTVAVPQEEEVTVELPRLAPIAGRVQWEDGAPAAQVVVIAHWSPPRPGIAGFAETRADGTFELPFLAAGRYVLETRRPSDRAIDVVPTTTEPVEGGTRDVAITARRGGKRISGRCVTGTGAAVPGAVLFLKPAKGGAQVNARSAPDGRFDAAGLADGAWSITGMADRSVGGPEAFGRKLTADAVEVEAGAREVVLEFREAAPISGKVVREDGGVPAGSLVVQAKRGAEGKWTHFAPCQADGGFVFPNTTTGEWHLAVVDTNTGAPVKLAGETKFAGGAKDVRLVVATSAAIAGTVTDDRGRPVGGVGVLARGPDGAKARAVSDAEGRFSIAGLAPGPWSLEAAADETGRAEATGLEPGGPEVTLALRPAEAVAARVVLADGTPLRGADVTLALDGTVVTHLRTDAEGRFATRALPPGEYAITLVARDGRPLDAPVDLGRVRSGAADVVLRL